MEEKNIESSPSLEAATDDAEAGDAEADGGLQILIEAVAHDTALATGADTAGGDEKLDAPLEAGTDADVVKVDDRDVEQKDGAGSSPWPRTYTRFRGLVVTSPRPRQPLPRGVRGALDPQPTSSPSLWGPHGRGRAPRRVDAAVPRPRESL